MNGGIIGVANIPTQTTASGVWTLTEQFLARVQDIWPLAGTFAMELVAPSSIAFSGTSASVVGLGSVDFSAVTSLSLNGVFSAEYDNYMLAVRHVSSAAGQSFDCRLRVSASDASGSDYTWQTLRADGSTVDGVRSSSQTSYRIGSVDSNLRSGLVCYVYGPNLAQPTAFRSVSAEADSAGDNARVFDVAGTHSLSTAYDGLTLYPGSGNITGNVAVYGLRG